MARYLLCAEDVRVNRRAPLRLCWHVARVGESAALCTRPLEAATSVRPLQEADSISEPERCVLCWARAFDDLMLPA